tara:strand:+ start:201 stop:611 length:411 start_codon:yes stop_codon:yes gene_type:complete
VERISPDQIDHLHREQHQGKTSVSDTQTHLFVLIQQIAMVEFGLRVLLFVQINVRSHPFRAARIQKHVITIQMQQWMMDHVVLSINQTVLDIALKRLGETVKPNEVFSKVQELFAKIQIVVLKLVLERAAKKKVIE